MGYKCMTTVFAQVFQNQGSLEAVFISFKNYKMSKCIDTGVQVVFTLPDTE